jgi:class 3 adenylate cyclase/pimeloyl-ACP methyl ester carboxylesterase
MADEGHTLYTRSADGTNLTYQVTGAGRLALVFMHGNPVPIDLMWDDPGLTRVRKRLAAFSRTVWFEPRGLGASAGDPVQMATGEHFDEDLIAALDDAGCERVALVAASALGSNAIAFTAAHPDRVSALLLVNTWGYYIRDRECPWGVPAEKLQSFAEVAGSMWGTTSNVDIVAPSRAGDERFRQWWARCSRLGATPEQLRDIHLVSFQRDVRPLLPHIEVPTLVLHRQGDRYIRAGSGRYLAEHIPNAKFVLLPGDDHLCFVGDSDRLVDEIEEFLTGRHQAPEGDLVLATVLFTDIVNSTEQAARVGPREWNQLSGDHDALVRAALQRHGGREIKTLGDGFLATFNSGTQAVRCAADITRGAAQAGLGERIGIHSGEIELRGDDIAGLTVTIAKRICDLAGPGQILISETIKEMLVVSGLSASPHGTHRLKGVPDEWRLWDATTASQQSFP